MTIYTDKILRGESPMYFCGQLILTGVGVHVRAFLFHHRYNIENSATCRIPFILCEYIWTSELVLEEVFFRY